MPEWSKKYPQAEHQPGCRSSWPSSPVDPHAFEGYVDRVLMHMIWAIRHQRAVDAGTKAQYNRILDQIGIISILNASFFYSRS